MIKSPFYVVQDFLSPLMCEQIVDNLNYIYPDKDQDERPIKSIKSHDMSEELIFEKLQPIIPDLEAHYDFKYRGTTTMAFEWFPQACQGQDPHCENSAYTKGKWVRTKDRDLTGIIFFCDYRNHTPFDSDFEVYGGKLEFFQHRFGFNPNRGTLILFPSEPHFINGTTLIEAGDLFQVRFHIAADKPYLYHPRNFPGDYTTWFENLA